MGERNKTIVCCFDPRSQRINAFQIHEWIYECLQIPEDDIRIIQIDGFKRHVYIKFTEEQSMSKIIRATGGQKEYKHETGEITQVTIEIAGLGVKKFRIVNLPVETNEYDFRTSLSKYGVEKTIRQETWAPVYRYKLHNGILIAEMRLKMHLPSHMAITGNDASISYDGQP